MRDERITPRLTCKSVHLNAVQVVSIRILSSLLPRKQFAHPDPGCAHPDPGLLCSGRSTDSGGVLLCLLETEAS